MRALIEKVPSRVIEAGFPVAGSVVAFAMLMAVLLF
jgi:cephalosporin hydroxylase